MLGRTDGASAELDYRCAFWAATLGGARAIGLDDSLGSFAVGKQFDAIIVDRDAGVYDSFSEAVLDATPLPSDFERFVNLGDDRNVHTVFVRGRVVKAPVERTSGLGSKRPRGSTDT